MSLNRRLERLETIVTKTVTAEPSPERVRWEAAWYWALELVLTNMPEDRARVVIDDLTHARDESPITRRVLTLAGSAVPAHWADPGACRKPRCECGWHYGHNDPLALPEAVCGLLDEHPEAVFDYLNCADCGYQSGERTREAWRRYPVGSQEITPAGRAYAGAGGRTSSGARCAAELWAGGPSRWPPPIGCPRPASAGRREIRTGHGATASRWAEYKPQLQPSYARAKRPATSQ